MRRGKHTLHDDGIVGVAGDVPARAAVTMWKERVAAGQILFRLVGIDLEIDLIVFYRDGEKADAVDGAVGWTKFRELEAEFVPGKVREIEKQQRAENGEQNAAQKDGSGDTRNGSSSHRLKNTPCSC